MTYNEANLKLTGRCKQSRKLANNTYLQRRGENIAVCLHHTDIIAFYPNGDISLSSGGWNTITTVNRINRYQPFRVWRKRNEMFIRVDGRILAFASGIHIAKREDSSGHIVTNHGDIDAIKAEWRKIDREKSRVNYWIRKAGAGASSTRLTSQKVMDERNDKVQMAKAQVYGHLRLASEVGEIVEKDAEYELILLELPAMRWNNEYLYLRCLADGTLAPVKALTIKDAIFEALTNGFQKAKAYSA